MSKATYHLRYMNASDIPSIIDIDRASFSMPWSARSYAYEVQEASYSHMAVLERTQPKPDATPWQRFWQAVGGQPARQKTLLGYGGLWMISNSAHISTIASHPDHRRQGWGEAVFLGLLRRALSLGAEWVLLEVRVSNTGAQALYKKYGFTSYGVKAGYYRDNGEDAYDMRMPVQEVSEEIETRYRALQLHCPIQDSFTHGRKRLSKN